VKFHTTKEKDINTLLAITIARKKVQRPWQIKAVDVSLQMKVVLKKLNCRNYK